MTSILLLSFLFQDCTQPPARITPRGPTIFSEKQDAYLGDAVAEQMQRGLTVYRQPGLVTPLENIAKRLLRHLPANEFQFTFTLIELLEPNAFVLPGGRVFVSRKLIAFVESEDELAGVLAHEMGHVLARQSSIRITKELKDILNVTAVGDRNDVFEKFNQLIDNTARKSIWSGKHVDNEVEADRISLQALARAGYEPSAMATFLDRLTDNKGETGNAMRDFFGLTRPESKRVRELLKSQATLLPGCADPRDKSDEAAFRAWQKRLAELPSHC